MAAVSLYMGSGGKEIVPWREDFDAAKLEAQQAHRPMLLYFTASWCEPCQYMKGTTFASTAVKDSLANFVPVKLDIDRYKTLALQYGIETVPRFFVLDETGKITRDYDRAMTEDEFLAWIKKS